jgi:predicted ATP-dependent protease
MAQAATRDDIDEVLDLMKVFMKQVDERFSEQEKKYDHLITTIDGFIGRIDKYEIELAARDAQFQRLLDWARKVSKKTGIPLENL